MNERLRYYPRADHPYRPGDGLDVWQIAKSFADRVWCMMIENFYARLVLSVLLVFVLAQVWPKAVNAVLVLVLIGIVLMRYPAFASLFRSTLGALSQNK